MLRYCIEITEWTHQRNGGYLTTCGCFGRIFTENPRKGQFASEPPVEVLLAPFDSATPNSNISKTVPLYTGTLVF